MISVAWREAEGVVIPKEDEAETEEKFRTTMYITAEYRREGFLFPENKQDNVSPNQ